MKKTVLKNYAALIARAGVNVQKGQPVMIYAQTDQPEFVKYVVEQCYRCGASKVMVEFDYQPLTALHVRYRSLKTLSSLEDWEIKRLEWRAEHLPCMIYLLSEDPDGLKGMNQKKYSRATQAKYPIIKPFRDRMDNRYQWCIAAVPGADWAKKMFPHMRTSAAIEKLWQAILYTSRALEDPIAAWEAHNRELSARCAYLNNLHIQTLEYHAKNGTDLRVGLIDDGLFLGGAEQTLQGVTFNANIPSEEVFTSPMRGKAEGIVYSSRPLSYRGELIENFSIRFKDGCVSEVHAEKNEALLQQMVHMDDGAAHLGECALVPYDSPIRNSNLTFYNTLFDENAACHLALGEGFTNTIRHYENYSKEELHQKGINESMIHEDFMIGTEDLQILAHTKDGNTVELFRNGNWAFDVDTTLEPDVK